MEIKLAYRPTIQKWVKRKLKPIYRLQCLDTKDVIIGLRLIIQHWLSRPIYKLFTVGLGYSSAALVRPIT